MLNGWQARLKEASTPQDVVDAARDFLALRTSQEMALLPEECRPGEIRDEDDLTRYALKLASSNPEPGSPEAGVVRRVGTFFTRAALKIVELREELPRQGEDQAPKYGAC
jgi:hypothetical protein